MRKIYTFLVLTFLLACNVKSQNINVWIDSTKIEPNYVTTDYDSFNVITFIRIGLPFYLRETNITASDNNITISCCYQGGSLNESQSQSDTFRINVPIVGNYTIFYLAKVSFPEEFDSLEFCKIDTKVDTAVLNLTVHPAVGISERPTTNFTLHPNPATNTVTIQLPGITATAQLILYNTIGEVVLQQTTTQANTPIDISQLPAGIYFVQVETEKGRGVKRLVVAK